MKPRTKIQKEVFELMKKLPPINENQKQWAKENCFPSIGYVCKGEVWCSHCSKTFIKPIPELGVSVGVEKKARCPYCGKELKLEVGRAKKKELNSYMTIVTTIGGWQVLRHVVIYKYIYKNQMNIHAENPNFFICEAVQQWINEEGKSVTVARPRNFAGYSYNWIYTKEMRIRDISRLYSYEKEYYNIEGNVYPIKRVIPILKRNGYNGYIPETCSMHDVFSAILNNNKAETLIKAKQFKLLEWMVKRHGINEWMWPSVKIAIRNGYKVDKPDIWHDMLEAMWFLHKDLRNSFFVCPKDVEKAHDEWVAKKRKKQDEDEKKKMLMEARQWEENYKKKVGKFLGIVMKGEGINVRIIQSVAEMAEEGMAMHHCVFSMGYYKKKDSLILSARDEADNRLETVEVSLSSLKVMQCFGRYNKITPEHNKILELVNKNMGMIAKAM